MNNQQSFHAANYRGNMQGHDSYLRSDSSSPSMMGSSNAYSNAGQQSFQPTGNVPSYYGQNQNQGSNQGQSMQSFHTANYRGDQQGHDQYLRSDSQTPSNFGQGYGGNSAMGMNQNRGNQFQTSFTGSYGQSASPQSYHTANYRGDQQGHDSYLRSDSQQPSQFNSYSMNQSIPSYGQNASQFQNQNQNQNQFQNQGQFQTNQNQNSNQYQNPQSYHTANYKGNQQGHDSYLRSDSSQPSGQGF